MGASARGLLRAVEDARHLAVRQLDRDAQEDGRTLLGRQRRDRRPCARVIARGCSVDRRVVRVGHGHGPSRARPAGVDRLAPGDRECPRPEVRLGGQVGVGAQRGEAGLLEAVLGVVRADDRCQKAQELGGVTIEEGLKGRERHTEKTRGSAKA